ncbi:MULTISPECIES: hypothetical protein [unclassified Gilliamella]|uniref:hypothetical protein n=1 Tax=unclassified Gilliamella TaxID=2685620 RepID=UPI0013090184|nr:MULTISPECIES: hypothetical protein [unclassified Gilliamella]MWP48561.1 hypothetical protein [Gilliamella sp. Lep-s35]MWP68623.1 hypothetical protein [Gilliamella sp. Lep-s5]MWP76709.1 hypothetical protein [Gilliamella sp. Lep-s21]
MNLTSIIYIASVVDNIRDVAITCLLIDLIFISLHIISNFIKYKNGETCKGNRFLLSKYNLIAVSLLAFIYVATPSKDTMSLMITNHTASSMCLIDSK